MRKYCRVAGRGLRPVMADHRNKIRRATQQERKEQMDGKDKLLWRHSAFARPFHFMGVRGMLPLLQPNVLNNRAMDSSLNGRTAGGRTRKAFKLKEFFCSGVNRGLDLIVVQCGLWDYEHKQQRGLLSGPGRQLH